MTQHHYVKKVVVNDEHSTPEARGKRLRWLRNVANLSRKSMCANSSINFNTLKGWELGRYGGLPKDGAEKVIARVYQEGVSCELEWLLYGQGQGPQIIEKFAPDVSASIEQSAVSSEDYQLIEAELELFKQHHPAAIACCIVDDAMAPRFQVNDTAAGVLYDPNHWDSLHKVSCIARLANGEVLVRTVHKNPRGFITLISDNPQTTVMEPVLHDAAVTALAPVVWHRRPCIINGCLPNECV